MRARLTGALLAGVLLTSCTADPAPKTAIATVSPSASSPDASTSPTGTVTPPTSSPSTPVPAKTPGHPPKPKPPTPRPHRPSPKPKAPDYPSGASAVCRDGTLSYSQHRRGTCSHHGGVARWL
ncbi:DUF3761 domain-containing protein [Actinomadura gamaensis]|uniref:DUF3761 domain-containing protein n=1 Tax=Actinomadura gamaensis TaxID=1763541 RepID=A0ABV9U695_9ACTN